MFKNKWLSSSKDMLFRMSRSEGTLRGFFLILYIGLGGAIGYLKSTYYDPIYAAPKLIE